MTKEEIELQGSDVFLELDEIYNTQTSFIITGWEDGNFILEILITNRTEEESYNKLVLDIDYIIEILKKTKRLGLLIDYHPTFKYHTSIDDVVLSIEVSFFYSFWKVVNI